MKVLLDQRISTGGVGRYGRELAEELRDLPGIEIERFTSRGLATAPFTPWGRRAVKVKAINWGADLIHGTHFEVPSGLPSVVTIQDVIPLEFPESMPSAARRFLFRRIIESSMNRALRTIVPSTRTAESLTRFGADPSRIEVIPLWAAKHFRPSTHEEIHAARVRFAGGKRYIASMSHPKAHKNSGILPLTSALIDAGFDLVLVDIGDKRLGDDELRTFYGGAELFLLPSLFEGFGLPALESLACGVPIVCGPRVGALPYIKPGVIEVDVEDPQQIADAINSVLADPQRMTLLRTEGMRAASELTLEAAAAQTMSLYVKALSG